MIKERKRKNRLFFLSFFVCLFFIVFSLVFDDMGIIRYLHLKKGEQEILNKIRGLDMERITLTEEIDKIESDNFYLEKKAREELGLSRPDEYIFKFEE